MNITKETIESLGCSPWLLTRALNLTEKLFNLKISSDGQILSGQVLTKNSRVITAYATVFGFNSKLAFKCSCLSINEPCAHSISLLYAWLKGVKFRETAFFEDEHMLYKGKQGSNNEIKLIIYILKMLDKAFSKINSLEDLNNRCILEFESILSSAKKFKNLETDLRCLIIALEGKDTHLKIRCLIFMAKRVQITKAYLKAKINNFNINGGSLIKDPYIERWILRDSKRAQLQLRNLLTLKTNIKICELYINSYYCELKRSIVSKRIFLDLESGRIMINECSSGIDSCPYIFNIDEAYLYSDDDNCSIVFDSYRLEKAKMPDIKKFACDDFSLIIDKLNFEDSFKSNYFLVKYDKFGTIKDRYAIKDKNGYLIILEDKNINFIDSIKPKTNGVLLLEFLKADFKVTATVLSLITDAEIIKLT